MAIVPHCLLDESYPPQSDVYKVLLSLPLTNSVGRPIFFVSFQHRCASAKCLSAVALECGFVRLDVKMPLDYESGPVVQAGRLRLLAMGPWMYLNFSKSVSSFVNC